MEPFRRWSPSRSSADFPKTLRIRVREHRPVAALVSGDGRRVAVASDGTLLPRERGGSLPVVKVDSIPPASARWKTPEERWSSVLAGAPRAAPLLERAYRAQDGVRVAMRTGRPALRLAGEGGRQVGGGDRVLADRHRAAPRCSTCASPSARRPASSDPASPRRPRHRGDRRRRRCTGRHRHHGGAARPRDGTSAPGPCSLNPESRVRALQRGLDPRLAWTRALQLADRATKLVQNIAWMGNFSYRAEPSRVRGLRLNARPLVEGGSPA